MFFSCFGEKIDVLVYRSSVIMGVEKNEGFLV